MKRLLTVVTTLLLAGAFLSACGDDDDPTVEDSSNTTVTVGDTNADESGGVTLTARDFSFNPSTLAAPAGSLTITLKNTAEDTEHNLTIDDLDIDEDIKAGDSKDVQIPVVEPGVYKYNCDFHPNTMLGTITIT